MKVKSIETMDDSFLVHESGVKKCKVFLDDSFLECRVQVSVTGQTFQKQKVVSNDTSYNPVFLATNLCFGCQKYLVSLPDIYFQRLKQAFFYRLKESKVAAIRLS